MIRLIHHGPPLFPAHALSGHDGGCELGNRSEEDSRVLYRSAGPANDVNGMVPTMDDQLEGVLAGRRNWVRTSDASLVRQY